jgi:Na+-driven multidrug efflux pump
MKILSSAIGQTLIIVLLGVIIGFLGELMPDGLKTSIEHFATNTLGVSYLKLWVISTIIVVLTMLFFVWRETLSKNEQPSGGNTTKRKVVQHGKGSIYNETNNGDIHIH